MLIASKSRSAFSSYSWNVNIFFVTYRLHNNMPKLIFFPEINYTAGRADLTKKVKKSFTETLSAHT